MFFDRLMSFLIGICTFGFYNSIYRSTHVGMTMSNCEQCREMSYKEFKKLFNSVEWTKIEDYDSLECKYPHNQYHASIICINGIGCILSSYGFIRAEMLKMEKLIELQS